MLLRLAHRWRRISVGQLLGLMLLGLQLPAMAEPVAATDTTLRDYDIPVGSLGRALSRTAAEAGVLLSVDARLLEGLSNPKLQGRFAPRQAFERLLQGSGLELLADGAGYRLRRRPEQASGSVLGDTLPLVSVRASGDGDGNRYRVTEAYMATRLDSPPQDLPQAISIVSGALIQDLALQSMAELVRYVPGMGSAQGEGNRDTPVFRGSASTADFLIDGIRDDMQYYRDFYNVERVEALRGPNAMIVGHGAVGGLINRVTKQPDWRSGRSLGLQLGAWQDRRATLDWNQAIDAGAAVRVNALYEDSGSYRQDLHLHRFGINPAVALRLGSRSVLTLDFEHFQDERTADRGVPSYLGRPVPVDPSTFFGNPELSRTSIRLNAFNAQLDMDLGGGRTLRNRTRYADYDKFFQNVFPGSVRWNGDVMEVALVAHNSRMRRHNTFTQTDLSLPFAWGDSQHLVMLGFELGRQEGDNRRNTGYFGDAGSLTTLVYVPVSSPRSSLPVSFRLSAADPDNASSASVVALYAQDQITLSPDWKAIVGLRHEWLQLHVRDYRLGGPDLRSTDRLWAPRVGLIYQQSPDQSFYLNFSLGYAPRAGEQLSSLTASNQSLKPESFLNHELGWKAQLGQGLDATAAVYLLQRRHVAVTDPTSASQMLSLVDGQRTRGLELSVSGAWRPGWQLMGAYTLQSSKIAASLSPAAQAGATMPHVPRHTLALWNRLALAPRWALGFGLNYRGAVFASTDNTVRLPGYTRVDAALYFMPDPHLRLQLNVENLFDRRYAAFAHSNNNITPGAPRAAKLSAALRF